MSLKKIIKQVTPPAILDAVKSVPGLRWEERTLKKYMRGGRVPWSPGYDIYRKNIFTQALKDKNLLDRFRNGESLPPGYGIGVDERCVEYPWLFAHLRDEPEVMLDAGSTLNYDFVLDNPVFRQKIIHILTLAPESNCFWQKGVSYLYHDLRDIPIRNSYYDTIVCLSTLEHVGFVAYEKKGILREKRPMDFIIAMRELARVLKAGGTFFLTVPFGVYRQYDLFQQFDHKLLSDAIEAFGKASEMTVTFYRYTFEGWNVANAADCAECEYVEWIMLPADKKPDDFSLEPDRAAAARAVACVKITGA